MAISIKSKKDIESLRIPNRIVAQTLQLLASQAKEGVSLLELDSMAKDFIASQGGRAAFYKLYGFPQSICTSLNQVIIHGIPNEYRLQNGDILGIDIGVEYGGWYGDAAISVGIGEISTENENLIACAKDVLYEAISHIKVGMRFKELSFFLQDSIIKRGFVPLRGFCGHGIGRAPHEEPEIPNYIESPNVKQGPKIKEGMVFCIEPMIAQKDGEPVILGDKWSVVSKDGLNGSHYEHTIVIVGGKAEILTEV
ncbi:type I methionyl aminopeptidase [Helicobacter cinaedi]|uniref:Methionine aminopeptidase n=1 Tax=Helicobacter cinaedi CCUG 18818 = ATCC BAA-847 TaxID=537971 RepID=A0AAI8MLM0_9HELI|nr:type I methionyl aminopeptidase [Helicobacter cinaedi]EFR46406.1 methionine aminopeptidase, type I [Helicobacter cinaedi CCUG 18818 = ATCC BAA-847]QOQ90011.1 type I methionyl aminopeptidase [Helicobacter cinaedi]BAM31853.1 methionine aminopeptidase [Helicobacter cinaedi CCUG 18818 = ATCC BAA-847]